MCVSSAFSCFLLLLLDAGTIMSFWGCSIFSECVYLFGSYLIYFLSFLSLFLLLSLLYWWFFYASASETNRLGLQSFCYKKIVPRGRGRGIVNCG